MILFRIILFILLYSTLLFAQSDLEYELADDIKDNQLENLSHIEAAFILSGATNQDTLDFYINWYHNLLETVERFNLDRIDRIGSAAKVFSYLHSTTLKSIKNRPQR